MSKRPLPVIIISVVYIAAGAGGLFRHIAESLERPFEFDIIWISLVGLIAVAAGVWMLRGRDWARWLALAWMAFHVVLSAFHSMSQVAIHAVFLALIAYFLFRGSAARYFRGQERPAGA
jgi:hypothetical protein